MGSSMEAHEHNGPPPTAQDWGAPWDDEGGDFFEAEMDSIMDEGVLGSIDSITDAGDLLGDELDEASNALGEMDALTDELPAGFDIPDLSLPGIPELSGSIPSLPSLPSLPSMDLAASLPSVPGLDLSASLPSLPSMDLAASLPSASGIFPSLSALAPSITMPDLGLSSMLSSLTPNNLLGGANNLLGSVNDITDLPNAINNNKTDFLSSLTNVRDSVKNLNVSDMKSQLKTNLLGNLTDTSNVVNLTLGIASGNTSFIGDTVSNIAGGAISDTVSPTQDSVFSNISTVTNKLTLS